MACANVGCLKYIRKGIATKVDSKTLDRKTDRRVPTNIRKEILAVRKLIRDNAYLQSPEDANAAFVSISGDELDPSLRCVRKYGKDNENKYIIYRCSDTKNDKCSLQDVYATKDKRKKAEAIENLTKVQILNIISREKNIFFETDK